MIISFIGNSKLHGLSGIRTQVKGVIQGILQEKAGPFVFYCGGYGDFDLLCATVLQELKAEGFALENFYVTPYLINDSRLSDPHFLKHYDGTIYPPIEHIPPRLAILARNHWMIDASDLVLCYVFDHFGGAAKARAYAKRKKKEIWDLV